MQQLLSTSLTIVYLAILGYAAYSDIKTMEVSDYTSLILYIIALVKAIVDGLSIVEILVFSILLSGFLYIVELCYQLRKQNKNDDSVGIGGADIKIAAAAGLFTREKCLLFIFIAFSLALIVSSLIMRKKNVPLIPYYWVSTVLMVLHDMFVSSSEFVIWVFKFWGWLV